MCGMSLKREFCDYYDAPLHVESVGDACAPQE